MAENRYSRGEKSRWWLKKVLTKSPSRIEEERHKDMCYILYLLAVNKGGFRHSKNGSSFFIHCLSHFLWAFKLLIDFFTKENGQKKTAKTLNAYKKLHRQCVNKLDPFLESPYPPLLTAKRWKEWHMSLCLSYSILKVNFTSIFFSHHRDFFPWL